MQILATTALAVISQLLLGRHRVTGQISDSNFVWQRLQDHFSTAQSCGAGIVLLAIYDDHTLFTDIRIDAAISEGETAIDVSSDPD